MDGTHDHAISAPAGGFEDLQERTEEFLTVQMPAILRTVECDLPEPSATPACRPVAECARAEVGLQHLRGASDCTYRVTAFGDTLAMKLQLNVWRLVIVYRIPVGGSVDEDTLKARLARWEAGAGHAGWTVGWRQALDGDRQFVETYCYAYAARDFLDSPAEQMFWRTDIMQMTRYFMEEARRAGIRLAT